MQYKTVCVKHKGHNITPKKTKEGYYCDLCNNFVFIEIIKFNKKNKR